MDKEKMARILFCLDFLMRNQSDEEMVDVWLSIGIPDGTMERGIDSGMIRPYLDLDLSEDDFNDMVKLAVGLLGNQVYGDGVFQGRKPDPRGLFA